MPPSLDALPGPVRPLRWAVRGLLGLAWLCAFPALGQDSVAVDGTSFGFPVSEYREPAPPPAERRELDRARWEELTRDVSYSEDPDDGRRPARSRTAPPSGPRGGSGGGSGGGNPPAPSAPDFQVPPYVRALLFALLLGLLGLLLFFLFRSRARKNRKISPEALEARMEEIERDGAPIHEGDMERWLREALEQGQYRLAVRIRFLAIMGRLAENGRIVRQKDKTNRAYLLEMSSHPRYGEFQAVVRLYERIWFGERPLDEPAYRAVAPVLEDFYRTPV
jgi:hypothetical protein